MPRVHGIDLHRKHGRQRRPNNIAAGARIDNNRNCCGVRLSSSTSSPALAPEYASAPLTASLIKDKVRDENTNDNDNTRSSSGISGKKTTGLTSSPLEKIYNSKSPLPENTSILTNTPSATSDTNGNTILLTTDTANTTSNNNFTPITTDMEIHPQSKELLDNLEFSSKSFSVATISHRAASSIAAGVDAGMDAVMEDIAKKKSDAGVAGDHRVGHSMPSSIPVIENGNLTLEENEEDGKQRQNQQQQDDEVNTDFLNKSANKLSSLSPSMSHSSSGDNNDNINDNDDDNAGDDNNNNDDDDDEDWDSLPLENMVNFLQRALRIGREGKQQGKRGTGGREHCTDIDTNGNNKNHGNSKKNSENNNNSDVNINDSRKSSHDLCSGGSDEDNATNNCNADEKSVSVSHGEEGSKASISVGNNNGKRSDGKNSSHFSEEKFIASQAISTAGKDDFGPKFSSELPLDNTTTKGKRNVVTPHVSKSKTALSISPDDVKNEVLETPEHEDEKDDDSTPRHANIPQPSEVQTQSITPAIERVALASSWKKPRSRHKKRMKNIEEKWKEAGTNGHSNIAHVDSTPVEHVKTSSTLESRPHERKDQSSGSVGGDENDIREAATQLGQNITEQESTKNPAQNPHVAENSTVDYDVERFLGGVKAMGSSESSLRTDSGRDSTEKWQKQREKIVSPGISKSCDVDKGSAKNEGGAKISTDKDMHEDGNNVEVQPSDIGITDEENNRVTIRKSKQISTANPEVGLEKKLQTLKASKANDTPSPSNRSSSKTRGKQKEKPRTSEESNRLKEGTYNKEDYAKSPKHSKKEKGYNHVAQATSPNRDIESEIEQKLAVRIYDPIDITPAKDRNDIGGTEVIDLTNDDNQQHNPSANANQESDDSEVWHDAKDELSMGNTQVKDDTNDSFLRTKSSTEQQNVHKSKRKNSTARIMFTGITPTTRHRRMIQSLGAELLESLEEASAATHLIATDGESIFRRTPKLMICICKTPNILSVEWLEKSSIKQQLLDTDDFLLLDNESAEKAYNFSMRESIRNGILARKKGGLLGGWCVYICSGVAGNKAPSVKELTLIIEATGARVITSLNDSDMLEPHCIMILTSDPSTEAQRNEFGVRKMERFGAQIVTTTWLFQTILTQQSPNMRRSEMTSLPSARDTVAAVGSSNCNSNSKKNRERLSHTMSSDESSTKGEAGDLSCTGKRNSSGSMVFDLEYAASSLFLENSLQSESRLCDDTPSRLPCRQFLSRDQFLSTYEKLLSFISSSDSDEDEIASEMENLWREYQDRYNDASPRKGKEDKNNFPPPSRRKIRSQKRQTSTSRPKSARGVLCRRGRKRTISTMVSPTFFVFDQPNEKPHGIPMDIILYNPFVTWEAYVLLKLRARAMNIPGVIRSTTLELVDALRFFPRPISIMRLRNDEEGNNPDTPEHDSTRVALRIDADLTVELQTNTSGNSKPKRRTQHTKRFKIFGTLQDVFDAHKIYQTSGMIPEQALALFALSTIDAVLTLHSCGVVHNNIGLDSFLVVKDLDNSNSSWFLQLIGFGDKSIILNCDKDVCGESHYDQDYFDLANVLHILLTGGIEVSLKTLPCGTVEFKSKPFIKGNMFLRGALVWCDIIDALLGIGDIVHDGKKSEGPLQLKQVLKYASCESLADGASDRIKQIGWACHTFRGIASHDVFRSFLDGLSPHATSRAHNSVFDCLSSCRSNSSHRQYAQLRPKISTSNRTANEDLELQLMKQQSEIEIKSLALAKREAALMVQETNIEHEKQILIRLESKYQSLIRREQAAQTKENALSKKEQNLILEAKHLYRIQQEILKRDEQREKNLHHFDDTNSPASPHELYSEKSYTPNNLSPSSDTRPSLDSWSHRRLPIEQNDPTSRTTLAQNPHLNHDLSDVSDCSHSYDDKDSLSTNSQRYRGRKNLSAIKSRCHNHSYSQGSVEHTCSLQLLENKSVKEKTPTRSSQGNSPVTSNSKKISKKSHHQNIENSSSAKGSRKRMIRESPEGRIFKRTPKKAFLSLDDD